MVPGKLNLTIYQGSTFRKLFQWKTGTPSLPVDITGCAIRMQIRQKITDTDVILELTTLDGITITDALLGKWKVEIPATETANLDFKQAVYDLEIQFLDGTVYRLFQGSVTLSPEVTR